MKYNNKSNKENLLSLLLSVKKDINKQQNIVNRLHSEIKKYDKKSKVRYHSTFAKLEENFNTEKHKLSKIEQRYKRLKKVLRNNVILVLSTASIALGGVGAYHNHTHLNTDDIVKSESFNQVNDSSDENFMISYVNFKNDIKAFNNLSSKKNLSSSEKEELKNLKKRIQSNPECITQFALDTLKQKIAHSIDYKDYTDIKIKDNTTDIAANQNYQTNGTLTNITISNSIGTIGEKKNFTDTTGTKIDEADSIPQNVLPVIEKIVTSQRDAQNISKATLALKSALSLDEKDLHFDEYEISKKLHEKLQSQKSSKTLTNQKQSSHDER